MRGRDDDEHNTSRQKVTQEGDCPSSLHIRCVLTGLPREVQKRMYRVRILRRLGGQGGVVDCGWCTVGWSGVEGRCG